jgi:eukaryotic-like serine/threonine-protein kinase
VFTPVASTSVTTLLRDQLQSSLGSGYTVERELGGGGMSRVFVVEDHRLGRRVVVKVLSPELAADISSERFERETLVAAKLQDPRIVPVLSAGDAGGLPFYMMPYIDGTSLRARMQDGPMALGSAISILRDIALALEHAHEHGVVHRDIKPENVLLTTRGKETTTDRVGTAMVTDFGISKAISAAKTNAEGNGPNDPLRATLTSVGTTIGTPAYMAPEQAAGDVVDHRADLYAWGVVAYEILSGAHPFSDRTTAGALVAAHIRDTPPPLRARRADLPAPLLEIVERALAKRPEDRPANAAEIVQALDAIGGVTSRVRSRMAVAVAVVALGIAAAALISRPAARTPAQSIAVLPFLNRSGDSADVYFAEGMSDELTTALGRLSKFRVASRSSAARFRDSTAVAAAKALNVDAVLEGTVRRAGAKVVITAALTTASDGIEIWSQSFERPAAQVFDVQDVIARAIVDSLRVALVGGAAPVGAPALRGTNDLEAYDLYLQGRYAWSKRGRDLFSAVRLYQAAIARDPKFARAYAGLAMAYVPMMVYGVASGDSVLPHAAAAATKALELDSTLADAHLALASVRRMQWNWKEAESHFLAAIDNAPSDATAHQWYGGQLYSIGRVDEAVTQLKLARDLDPISAALGTDVTYGLYVDGLFDEALKEGQRTVSLDTSLAISHWLVGATLLAMGRVDTAVVAFQTAQQLGATPDARPVIIDAYRRLGRSREADSLYATVVKAYRTGSLVDRDMAIAAVAHGDFDAALASVRRAIERREPIVTEYSLPCDPLFDRLKARPEFAKMLEVEGMRVCPAR